MAGMNESNPNDNEICALRDEAEIPIEELKAKLQQVLWNKFWSIGKAC